MMAPWLTEKTRLLLYLVLALALGSWKCIGASLAKSGRSLTAPGKAFSPPVTGSFETLGEAPVAATHTVQIPKTNSFLIIDFLNGDPHPPMNGDGTRILWSYDRGTNTYRNIPSPSNLVCGGWTKLADGSIAMFGGHALFYNLRNGVQDLFVYNINTGLIEDRGGMIAPRWYATALTLPDGMAYVFGGTTVVGAYTKSPGAELYDPVTRQKQFLPVNAELMAASIGNFYVGAWVLPTGDMVVLNSNMVQVINPYSGVALARGPALPGVMGTLRWEYPYSGTQILLSIPIPAEGANTWDFVIFGGQYEGAFEMTTCSRFSLRLSLTVRGPGAYEFGPWVVEEMPGPRCHMDSVLLPNGKVLLVNGAETGIGGLPDMPEYSCGNCANEPVTEPWEYDPLAPVGKRYTRTGAFSTIPRLYHQTGLLTSDGDVLLGGCSNCGVSLKASKYSMALYSRTLHRNSEYRLEVYRPRYVFSPLRPTIMQAPEVFAYGSTNAVTYTLAAGSGPITKVVLQDTGTTTHGFTMNRRQLELRFTRGGDVLQVQAPLNGNWAAPTWYLLFILVGDVYSTGRWVQLAGGAPASTPGAASLLGGPWNCLPFTAPWTGANTHMAVRRSSNGQDVQCLAPPLADTVCMGFTGLEACDTYIQGKQGYPALTCGADHTRVYNTPGYNDPAHWCDQALAFVANLPAAKTPAAQAPAPKPAPPAAQAPASEPSPPEVNPPAVPVNGGPWTCMPFAAYWMTPNTHLAVRQGIIGPDVECLSPPTGASICQGFVGLQACRDYIVNKENEPALTCGSEHLRVYGDTGYDNAGHWCDQARALVGSLALSAGNPPAVTPAPGLSPGGVARRPTAWHCIFYTASWLPDGQGFHALRVNKDNDVECLSLTARTCVTYATAASCERLVAIEREVDIQPLACGSAHAAIYGDTGYDTAGHWCKLGQGVLAA